MREVNKKNELKDSVVSWNSKANDDKLFGAWLNHFQTSK